MQIWSKHIAALLSEPEIGVLLGATALLLGIVSRSYTGFEACVPKLVAVLKRMRAREVGPDYTYYGIASPWLQVSETARDVPTDSAARLLSLD